MYYGKALSYDYVARDIDCISHEALKVLKKRRALNFRKIYRRAGIRRLCSGINRITPDILKYFMRMVITKAITYMYSEKKKTLSLIHILYALK